MGLHVPFDFNAYGDLSVGREGGHHKSRVVHAMKENSGIGVEKDQPGRIGRYWYAFRNEAYLYRQEGFRGVCYYIFNCLRAMARVLVKAKDHRGKRLGVILKGMWSGLFFRPKVRFCGEK